MDLADRLAIATYAWGLVMHALMSVRSFMRCHTVIEQEQHAAEEGGGADSHRPDVSFVAILLQEHLWCHVCPDPINMNLVRCCGYQMVHVHLWFLLLARTCTTLARSVQSDQSHAGARHLQQSALAINPADPVSATVDDLLHDPTGKGHLLV